MPGGNVGPGVCVDLSGWTTLGDVDRDARTVEAGPGVLGAQVESAALEHGLCFPALPSSAERCTVGGMVANNAAGARSYGHGAVNRWVESIDVVLADGSSRHLTREAPGTEQLATLRRDLATRLGHHGPASHPDRETDLCDAGLGDAGLKDLGLKAVKPWPNVRKNASGYALDRFLPEGDPVALFVGSEGTLGFITNVRLSLSPEPEDRATVLLPVPDDGDLDATIDVAETCCAAACEYFGKSFIDIAGLRSHPETSALLARNAALLLIELEGHPDEVSADLDRMSAHPKAAGVRSRVARAPDDRARLWAIRHAASPVVAARASNGLVSMQFIEDSVVPRARLSDYVEGLGAILARAETEAVIFGHAGEGNLHVNPLVDVGRADWRDRVRRILDETVDLVARLGGTLSGEHGDGRIRAPFHDRIWGTELADAFRTVKRTLDPDGILNPGVVVPLPGQDPLAGLSRLGGMR